MGNLTGQPLVAHAFSRFGFGGRPDDTIPADAVQWLTAQITGRDPAPASLAPSALWGLSQVGLPIGPALRAHVYSVFEVSVQNILTYAVTTTTPFRERLVWFWANNLAVMASTVPTVCLAAQYVRDAIRPNVTGTYSQMLQAAILHPAMVYSLNAVDSIGPQSPTGLRLRQHGVAADINENLAREALELYSVGLAEGYTQADVDALACLLSGVNVKVSGTGPLGTFHDSTKQQPGNQVLLGRSFPGTQAGLLAALDMLGTHPATYQQIATKLVAHFVSDNPDPADVTAVYNALAGSGGSLPAAYNAVIALPNAWIPLQKLRTPADYVFAILRAANTTAANMPTALGNLLNMLGQPIWQPPFPNGWPDTAGGWLGVQAMLLRGEWANAFGASLSGVTYAEIAQSSLGPLLSSATDAFLQTIPTVQEQLGLFFCCSEFQRR